MHIDVQDVHKKWKLFTLTNKHGMRVSILNFGGILTDISVMNKQGVLENVVLGFKDVADYEHNPNYIGALIGPVAGRIENSNFQLGGKKFSLEANEGPHHLHGGSGGFHQVVWQATSFQTTEKVGVRLTHFRPDGEGGYHGNLDVSVTYTVTNDNELIIDYEAESDQTTALTLTNHSYFNLSGHRATPVHDHHITMNSKQFIELDQALLPTGRKRDVSQTPFDFRKGRKIVDKIESVDEQNKRVDHGYDHYFIFSKADQNRVIVKEATSGRVLTITTDQPGMVMYTANGLPDDIDIETVEHEQGKYMGICFETQAAPASLHHDGFPSVELPAGETYAKQTVFSFHSEK